MIIWESWRKSAGLENWFPSRRINPKEDHHLVNGCHKSMINYINSKLLLFYCSNSRPSYKDYRRLSFAGKSRCWTQKWNTPYLHSALPASRNSLCTSRCTSCTHLQCLDFRLSVSSVYIIYSSGTLVAGNERICCLISCLTSSFKVCTTMLMSTSIICVNNVCSISLPAVENASLLITSIRMKKLLHTSPYFLIQGNNQESRICCFQKISCSTSM